MIIAERIKFQTSVGKSYVLYNTAYRMSNVPVILTLNPYTFAKTVESMIIFIYTRIHVPTPTTFGETRSTRLVVNSILESFFCPLFI